MGRIFVFFIPYLGINQGLTSMGWGVQGHEQRILHIYPRGGSMGGGGGGGWRKMQLDCGNKRKSLFLQHRARKFLFGVKSAFFDGDHLAEVVRSKPVRRIYGKAPHTAPFWAYSRTLVKSLFCPINASPNEFLVRTPPSPPPPLETHFLGLLREVGGGGGAKNRPPHFLG